MHKLLASCGHWCEFLSRTPKRTFPTFVGISLRRNSLPHAYLYIRECEAIRACFPLNCLITSRIEEKKITILFFGYENSAVEFHIPEPGAVAILNGQIGLCSCVSLLKDDIFHSENALYLSQAGEQIQPFFPSAPIAPLFPMLGDPRAKKTWESRCKALNSAFVLEGTECDVLVYSWNVADHQPDESTDVLVSHVFQKGASVVFIVLQEIDFSAAAILFGGSSRCREWGAVFDRVGDENGYEMVVEDSLGGVYVRVAKLRSYECRVTERGHCSLRFGASGLTANKSAIISVLDVEGVSFGLVGGHLAAHGKNLEARNEQLLEIMRELERLGSDYAIIAGDLNYRVELPYEVAVDELSRANHTALLAKDQLLAFLPSVTGLFEEPISFPPTYKFIRQDDVYDTSKNQRVPSWTDRVLLKMGPSRLAVGLCEKMTFETDIIRHVNLKTEFVGESCCGFTEPRLNFPARPTCLEYTHCPTIRISDHRPVLGIWRFLVPRVNPARYAQFQKACDFRLAEFARLTVPKCTICPQSFEVDQTAVLDLVNVSCVPVKWKLLSELKGAEIEPSHGVLMPSHNQMIKLTVTDPISDIRIVLFDIEGGSALGFEFWSKESENSVC
jgi:hypothetical protein